MGSDMYAIVPLNIKAVPLSPTHTDVRDRKPIP